jgi:hypothetical protein
MCNCVRTRWWSVPEEGLLRLGVARLCVMWWRQNTYPVALTLHGKPDEKRKQITRSMGWHLHQESCQWNAIEHEGPTHSIFTYTGITSLLYM